MHTQYWEMYLTAGVVTRPYYFGGARVAQQNGTTLTNVYQSHPTGTKFMQDSVGASVGAITYFPYGSTRSETGTMSTDKRFSGQRLDSAKGRSSTTRGMEPALRPPQAGRRGAGMRRRAEERRDGDSPMPSGARSRRGLVCRQRSRGMSMVYDSVSS
ncbi:MAG: hypothetical protein IIC80_06075 [Chloroflexi bacterium]|nr:hypothetical protein [Chloroflexota bacterium]